MALASLPRQIACFIYDDFQQCSGLSHTSFQELSGEHRILPGTSDRSVC